MQKIPTEFVGKMKVLVIGSGGREHAIVDALSRSAKVSEILCAPGNAGIAQQAECIAIKDTDVEGLCRFALDNEIDLAVCVEKRISEGGTSVASVEKQLVLVRKELEK